MEIDKNARQLIFHVYRTCNNESPDKCPVVAWHRVKERRCKALDISRRMLLRFTDNTESNTNATEGWVLPEVGPPTKRDSVDSTFEEQRAR